MSSSHRLKVLVEAYECSPMRHHAAGSAWNILLRLSEWHDLWIIVEESLFRHEIEEWMVDHPGASKSLKFYYIRRPLDHDPCRGSLPMVDILLNRIWQRRALSLARQLHTEVCFDIAHHLRRNSFREPGLLWKLGIPFVWGPTGSPSPSLAGFLSLFSLREKLVYRTRKFLDQVQFDYDPRICSAVRSASCILVQNMGAAESWRKRFGITALVAHEQCAGNATGFEAKTYRGDRPLKLVWVGRFIPTKALPLMLRAIHRSSLAQNVELHIVGDGPCCLTWRNLAVSLGLRETCIWHGWLSSEETLKVLLDCDVLVFTSLREGTPATVVEALGAGLPVICLARCGQRDMVNNSCGRVISDLDFESAVNGLTTSLREFIDNPALVTQLSHGALRQARNHRWCSTVKKVCHSYRRAAQVRVRM